MNPELPRAHLSRLLRGCSGSSIPGNEGLRTSSYACQHEPAGLIHSFCALGGTRFSGLDFGSWALKSLVREDFIFPLDTNGWQILAHVFILKLLSLIVIMITSHILTVPSSPRIFHVPQHLQWLALQSVILHGPLTGSGPLATELSREHFHGSEGSHSP